MSRDEERITAEARAHATIFCTEYKRCLDKAVKNGDKMNCLCREYNKVKNSYQKGMYSSDITIDHASTGEFKLRLPY